jgi:AcrR family transcriptional regulator
MSDNAPAATAPPRLTRAQSKARTRELLLSAAAESFAARGYEGSSAEQIAESAGFSVGALYPHFGGKQGLFSALMTRRATALLGRVRSILREQPPGPGRRTALGQAVVDAADRDGAAALHAEFWLYAVRHPEVLDALVAQRRGSAEELRELLAEQLARMSGDHPDVEALAPRVTTVVTALFEGLVAQRRIDPDSVDPELCAQAFRWLLRGVGRDLRPGRGEGGPR